MPALKRTEQHTSGPLDAICPNCGEEGFALATCKECGEFVPIVAALAHVKTLSMWRITKIKDGAQAGKWALIDPQGEARNYYPRKKAAELDALLHNSGKDEAENNMLRAIALADTAVSERDALRAENARLRAALEKAQQIADSIRYDRHMNISGARAVANALHAEARAALGAK